MMKTGLVSNVEQIYFYIEELKNVNNEFITNCYMNAKELEYLVPRKKLIYEYKEDCYLNLLCREDDFLRLYFFIADIDRFCIEKRREIIVCDLFTTQIDERFEKIMDKLSLYNFSQYACFEKWKAKSPRQLFESILGDYIFGYDKEPETISMLFDIFDKYTDYLPCQSELDDFFADKKFINLYEKEEHKLMGSLIYSQKGKEFVTEYCFVRPEERGKGISYLLFDHYYHRFQGGNRFAAWINVENKKSIRIHQRYLYQKMKLKKYTFLKKSAI